MPFFEFLVKILFFYFLPAGWIMWFILLFYHFHKSLKKISALLLALCAQICGAYLIIQHSAKLVTQGQPENINDPLGLLLIGLGFGFFLLLTALACLKKQAPPKH